MRILVVGDSHAGRLLAERISRSESGVALLCPTSSCGALEPQTDVDVAEVDPADAGSFREAGVDRPAVAIVATGRDSTNLLVAQLMRATFRAERVVAIVNDPQNVDTFEDLGVEAVCASTVLADALAKRAGRAR